MAVDPARVKSLFLAASDLTDPAERAAYLDRECAGATDLRARVEALLRADAASPLPPPPTEAATRAHPTSDATGTFAGTEGDARAGCDVTRTADHHPSAAPGLVLAGRYKLIEPIGEGGMGTVWMAQQFEPVKRAVAVKLIKAGMDSQAMLARFEAERQALALMDHPNIAKVLDAGLAADGRPFFVMELVKGVPITEFCDARKLVPGERLALLVPVCHAVQHAHQKGIIHRDLKPSNVLVALYDDRPVPKVIDFGVAKAVGQPLTDRTLMTGFGAVIGTPEYMSPEQASFNQLDVDTRSDVYSLGVILYELLTGSPPHPRRELEQAGLLEVLRVIREQDPQRPSLRLSSSLTLASLAAVRGTEPARLARLVRGELDWLVMKALEKDRGRRYATANALAADLQRYLAGEPVQAVPPSAGYRVRKFVHRHRAPVLTALAGAVLLLTAAAVSLRQAAVATRAERVANEERDAAGRARDAEAVARQQADDARRRTEAALDESREKTARMTYERAQALCEEGKADLGLLWMARSLELVPAAAADLDRTIRVSMNLWAGQLNTHRPLPPRPGWEDAVNVSDIAVSPDGQSLAIVDIAYKDGRQSVQARVWELSTGKLRLDLPIEEGAPAAEDHQHACVFSPDGRFVAATRGDRRVRVWNAATGQPVGPPRAHQDHVRGIAFDPRGHVLAAAAGTAVHFWAVAGGDPDGTPLDLGHEVLGVEYSGDGRYFLTWESGGVRLWDAATRQPARPLSGVDFPVGHAGFSPDGRYVLVTGRPNPDDELLSTGQFWEVATGQPVGGRMAWRQASVGSGVKFHRASFRGDGRVAVTGGHPIRLWEVPSGSPLGAQGEPGLTGGAERPLFGGDGRVIVAFAYSGPKRLLDVAPALEPRQRFPSPSQLPYALSAAPDGQTIAVVEASDRYILRLFNLSTGGPVGEPAAIVPERGRHLRFFLAYSPDGRSLATRNGPGECQVWDTGTGRATGPRIGAGGLATAAAFSPDGRLLAVGFEDGHVRLVDATSGEPAGPTLKNQRTVSRLSFSPDGRRLLTAGGRVGSIFGEARIWDLGSGQPLGPALEIRGEVHDASFSPNGKAFATGSLQLIQWDAETSRPLWTAPTQSVVRRLSYSPDGRRLLARFMEEQSARLFDARTGTPLGPHLRHRTALLDVRLSPDGRSVLTCGEDRQARLWDSATGLPLGPPWPQLSARPLGEFTPDGHGVLLQGDGVVSRWDLPGPVEGPAERVRLAVEAATHCSLDEHGGVRFLWPMAWEPDPENPGRFRASADPSRPVRLRLEELGGPPGHFRR